ncbi:E3 ubiquitin-protein ligase rnf146 [Drosophila albomicans]|uniref:E3 ubiquitin-protein ligase rnf146 n=1 Tax=Drosophila albomicans TaxID=7291 RepID=A0A6P8X3A2_DROAB|nr:E3 ubiquitin-protein ligase rnf146 [Drosophila albomicans]
MRRRSERIGDQSSKNGVFVDGRWNQASQAHPTGKQSQQTQVNNAPASELEVCAFCLDAKRDPVLLRCQHSFCRSCLNLFYQARNWPAKRCPLCRSDLEPLQQQLNWRLFLLVMLAFCVLSIGPFYLLLTYW